MIFIALGAAFVIIVLFISAIVFLGRSPAREIPPSDCIVSPVDGTVVEIIDLLEVNSKKRQVFSKKDANRIKELANDTEDTAKNGYMIIISTGIFNTHVQRSPVEGKVISVKHSRGKRGIWKGVKILENSMAETLIKSKAGKIKVLQIAGALARKIDTEIKKGDVVLKGQQIGKTRLGSHVALIMPDHHLEISKGSNVFAGETIISYYGGKL